MSSTRGVSLIEEVVRDWAPGAPPFSVSGMTPDASLRRYFRVAFSSPCQGSTTLVAMIFDSVASPEAGGATTIDADTAYVELSRFFDSAGVSVPKLLHDARTRGVLLIEDLGSVQLADLVLGGAKSERLSPLFVQALDQIDRIQRIPSQPQFFPFERYFSKGQYVREMEEFRDFILADRAPEETGTDVVRALFEELAAHLETRKRVLVHRDFHGWNLLVDPSERLRIIDFQDALMATRPYDLVSLLNDRDMDRALGRELYVSLVQRFAAQTGENGRFLEEYDQVLLQRDLKVAGRFGKLVSVRKLHGYGAWIPGTLMRIGRTLDRIVHRAPAAGTYARFFDRMRRVIPEIALGADQPLHFDE